MQLARRKLQQKLCYILLLKNNNNKNPRVWKKDKTSSWLN